MTFFCNTFVWYFCVPFCGKICKILFRIGGGKMFEISKYKKSNVKLSIVIFQKIYNLIKAICRILSDFAMKSFFKKWKILEICKIMC